MSRNSSFILYIQFLGCWRESPNKLDPKNLPNTINKILCLEKTQTSKNYIFQVRP